MTHRDRFKNAALTQLMVAVYAFFSLGSIAGFNMLIVALLFLAVSRRGAVFGQPKREGS